MSQKTKILLVEDDSFLLKMYADQFEAANFETIFAEDGEKGLRLATKEKPDIILLDISLPKMDGFGVLENLKKNPETADIPVILLTNLSRKEEVEKGLALGAKDYLIKAHIMPGEVLEKVKEHLNK